MYPIPCAGRFQPNPDRAIWYDAGDPEVQILFYKRARIEWKVGSRAEEPPKPALIVWMEEAERIHASRPRWLRFLMRVFTPKPTD